MHAVCSRKHGTLPAAPSFLSHIRGLERVRSTAPQPARDMAVHACTHCTTCACAVPPRVVDLRFFCSNPDLVVEGHYHEADEPKPTIAKAVNMLYGFLLVTIIFGDKVFAALGMPMPGTR